MTTDKSGEHWQIEQLTKVWEEMEWWQAMTDMVQLAIYQLEERLKDEARLLSEYARRERPDQVAIIQSGIECDKAQLTNYRRWEDSCVMEMKRCDFRKREKAKGSA